MCLLNFAGTVTVIRIAGAFSFKNATGFGYKIKPLYILIYIINPDLIKIITPRV